jgi:uncharacterized membrane protein YsdA (DUF1294 family)
MLWWLAGALNVAGTCVLALGARWPWWIAWLCAINAATFLLYSYDKRAAIARWWRVPERLLHVQALLGGSPLAIVAQRLFRHKTIKGRFQAVMWLIVVVQAGALLAYAWWRVRPA